MCLEWGRKRGRPARSSLFAIFQGEKLVRQEIATFPVLRRVGNTDDGKTNVQFLGRAALGSAAAFAAFLDALVLPLLLPENEVLLRLYFLGVVWLVVVIVTKFAGWLRCVCVCEGCAGDQKIYVFLPESTGPANSVDATGRWQPTE